MAETNNNGVRRLDDQFRAAFGELHEKLNKIHNEQIQANEQAKGDTRLLEERLKQHGDRPDIHHTTPCAELQKHVGRSWALVLAVIGALAAAALSWIKS